MPAKDQGNKQFENHAKFKKINRNKQLIMWRKCYLSIAPRVNKLTVKPQCNLLTRIIYSTFKLDLFSVMVCFSGRCRSKKLQILSWILNLRDLPIIDSQLIRLLPCTSKNLQLLKKILCSCDSSTATVACQQKTSSHFVCSVVFTQATWGTNFLNLSATKGLTGNALQRPWPLLQAALL